jgi:hypothetical protein
MSIAYLIATHDSPNQTRRLIGALSSETARFFIHVDAKANLQAFSSIQGSAVHFIKNRVRVYWGDFSQVRASLNLIEAALAWPQRCQRLVLLSGSDFPLRSSGYIERFFAANTAKEFINSVPIPSAAAKKPLSRITEYRVQRAAPAPIRLLQKGLLRCGLMPRTRDYRACFGSLTPFGGSSWWALSRPACEHILAFVARNPSIVQFFHNTFCPDEAIFQTILNNSELRTRIVKNVTFADWSGGGGSPAFLSEKHLELFGSGPFVTRDDVYGSGEMLFARKFRDGDAGLVEKLQRQRHQHLSDC